jgi:ubiquinone/menaquinone biosynthesis C-methylase UbiE
MDARLQRRIQRYGWDKAAPLYERYWQDQLAPARERLFALADLQAGERVLDVACGTGLVTFPAAEIVGPQGSVVATDISDAMVSAVTAEASRRGLRHVAAARMDAENLELPDAGFDVVLCALGLMYVPDPALALGSVLRVLAPGGRAVLAVWGARKRCGWAEIFPIVDARVQSEVCPMFFALGTADRLEQAARDAGFADVRSERVDAILRYASAEDAVGAAFAGGPVALAYSRFDENVRREAHAEYLASIEPFRDGRGYAIPGEFVVTIAHRPPQSE